MHVSWTFALCTKKVVPSRELIVSARTFWSRFSASSCAASSPHLLRYNPRPLRCSTNHTDMILIKERRVVCPSWGQQKTGTRGNSCLPLFVQPVPLAATIKVLCRALHQGVTERTLTHNWAAALSGNASCPRSITRIEFWALSYYRCQVPWLSQVPVVNATTNQRWLCFRSSHTLLTVRTHTHSFTLIKHHLFT